MKQTSLLLLVLLLFVNISNANTELNAKNQKMKLSFSERFRYVTWDNAITLNDDVDGTYSFTRHRTSLMTQWYPVDKLELAVKLTNEFRYYFKPENRDFNLDEIFFDQLYLKWKDPLSIKGSLTLGRQNIILGEGFVVMDGGPLVGSRSIYFNAARFDWKFQKDKELTLFYIYQPMTDDLLPIINNQDAALIEKPENGFGLYLKTFKDNLDFDVYYIRKNIDRTADSFFKYETNTIGIRINDDIQDNNSISYNIEGAFQFGNFDNLRISALGGYFNIHYKTFWEQKFLPKKIKSGIIYLSGNNSDSNNKDNWDPLFSRWPKWSESYIYTLIKENGVAYWSNLVAFSSGMDFLINQDISYKFDYYHFIAPRTTENRWPFINNDGTTRGNLFISRINYKLNKNLTGHFLWEYFIPGDFYYTGSDSYNWFRFELMYHISN